MNQNNSTIKRGDIFIYDGIEYVAIDDLVNNFVWVINQEYYKLSLLNNNNLWGYTSACMLEIESNRSCKKIGHIK